MSHTSEVGKSRSLQSALLASRLAIYATVISIILLTAVHFLKADYNTLWRFVSEYEIGDYGLLMRGAFFAMGLAALSVACALWPYAQGTWAKIGLILQFVGAISLFGAATFVTDPANLPPTQMTHHGMMHVIFSLIGIPAGPLASLLVLYCMTRRASSDRAKLSWPAWTITISATVTFAYINVLMAKGHLIGPGDPVGIATLIVVLASDWWWISSALFARRLALDGST